jgi:arylsulfatase A-like enzyme
MTRRQFLGSTLAAGFAARAQSTSRPNIVFIFSDDHAYQAVGAYGSKLNQTPNIDRIAREGMRFDACLVPNSICAPSRAVILTGKYSHLNGIIDNRQRFDGSQQTFPKLLQKAGYQTALFGKWHLQSDPTGFDAWEVLPGQGNYYNPDFLTPEGRKRREGYVTDVTTDTSLNWLRNRDRSKPFLLMCQHKAPHRNWMPGPAHINDFEDTVFPEPPTLFDDYSGRAKPASQQEMEIGRHMTLGADLKVHPSPDVKPGDLKGYMAEYGRMNEAQKRIWDAVYRRRVDEYNRTRPSGKELVKWKYQQYMKDYLRCVASVDDSVGRILQYLDAEGLADNTLVVYSSDQGFYLGEHGWFDKRWIYEESIRTPCVARWPGVIKPASVSSAMVSNLDFAETFLEAAGAPVPADMQGRSLIPVLKGETPADWRKSFYYHYYEQPVHGVARHRGVRTDRYTLVHFYETDEWELFDRESDPRQMRSVYGDPKYASVRKQLVAEMDRLRAELKVPAKDPDRQ